MKTKTNILSFFLIYISLICNAQQVNWAHGHGSYTDDVPTSSVVDSKGNIIIGGFVTSGTQFGDTITDNDGAFLAKYDSLGNVVCFFQSEGRPDHIIIHDIALDSEDNIYAIGIYDNQGWGSDSLVFPIKIDSVTLPLTYQDNSFLFKLDSLFNLIWVKTYSAGTSDGTPSGTSIYIDKYDDLYITGNYMHELILDSITLDCQREWYIDFFIAKLNNQGNVIWAKSCGSEWFDDYVNCIDGDDFGNIYIVGSFYPYNAIIGGVNYNFEYVVSIGFIIKWDNAGNFKWIKHTDFQDYAFLKNSLIDDITVDKKGNIYAIGYFHGTMIFDYDTLVAGGDWKSFLIKLDSLGNTINSHVLEKEDYGLNKHRYERIKTDVYNNLYITATFNYKINIGTIQLIPNQISGGLQSVDIYIIKYNEIGYLQWVKQIGGEEQDYVSDISIGNNKRIYMTGNYASASIDLGTTTIINNSNYYDFDLYLISINDTSLENTCPEINANISSNKLIFCEGDSIKLWCNNIYGYSFLWMNDDNIVSNNYDSIFWVKESGNYKVIVNESFSCLDTSNILTISKQPPPVLETNADTIKCNTDSLVLSFNAIRSYHWSTGIDSSIVSFYEEGNYWVQITDEYGCKNIDTMYIQAQELPYLEISKDTLVCDKDFLDLNLDSSRSYFWDNGINSNMVTFYNNGSYWVEITDDKGCKNIDTLNVKFLNSPFIILNKDTSKCYDDIIIIGSDNQSYDYLWSTGSIESQIAVKNEGLYEVSITNECNVISDSIYVHLLDCNSYLDVPSAFSPNGDGNNDILYAVGKNVEDINFTIFNRWGEKVFESFSLESGWNGEYKGKKLESDVFMYYISATSVTEGNKIERKGSVTIVK
ncbi:MAG: hypothetical protein A2033_01095 [Bacteroidetes bacterium GWA2_31_9]|nr:MAG: hypothetical protein A2033_01095 [Bacteroidetes bacterium GWA2_31_9]